MSNDHTPLLPLPESTFRPLSRRAVVGILLLTWLVRCVFLWLKPAAALADAASWLTVAHTLDAGQNPYAATTLLNWPPLWMQCIFALSRIARSFGGDAAFFPLLFSLLIALESLLIMALAALLNELRAPRSAGLILIGLTLNPSALFLTCQHGNFDALPAALTVLFLLHLIHFLRAETRQEARTLSWLSACLLLGIAILTKTFPLILAPLLALQTRQLSRSTLGLGALLLLAPVLLGLSVLYVLTPAAIRDNVLAYRSFDGYFGMSGILEMSHLRFPFYNDLFSRLIYAWLLLGPVILRRLKAGPDPRQLVLIAGLLLLLLPTLGPGYGPQYLFWFLPFLLAAFGVSRDRAFRISAILAFAVIVGTYAGEYLFVGNQGALLRHLGIISPALAERMSDPLSQTLLRLPLFVTYLLLLGTGFRTLLRNEAPVRRPGSFAKT